MFFPERRLVCLTTDGDTLHMRRFVERRNDVSFAVSIKEAEQFKDGYRAAVVHDVIDILKMEPERESA